LTDFNSLTKPLLLSKDYYKKALISIVAAVLMNRIVFAFNAISRNQRSTRRIRMELIEVFFINITKMVYRNIIISYIVIFSVKCSLIFIIIKIFEN